LAQYILLSAANTPDRSIDSGRSTASDTLPAAKRGNEQKPDRFRSSVSRRGVSLGFFVFQMALA
jgi:hypothetical protein